MPETNALDWYRNTLVIKPGAIGYLPQLTPVIGTLKDKYPSVHISLMVGNSATASLIPMLTN